MICINKIEYIYIYIYHLKIYLYKDLFDLDMIFVWDKSAPHTSGQEVGGVGCRWFCMYIRARQLFWKLRKLKYLWRARWWWELHVVLSELPFRFLDYVSCFCWDSQFLSYQKPWRLSYQDSCWIKVIPSHHVSHKKSVLTFDSTGCLIWILTMVYYNPHITG